MIPLSPVAGGHHLCPHCPDQPLTNGKPVIGGTFAMCEASCPACGRLYLAHLDIAYAENCGFTIELATGEVRSIVPITWYQQSLNHAWGKRETRPVAITRENFRPLRRPLLVDCVDKMFGHCLQRLFNVPQLVEKHPDRDVIVLVQDFARWLVPDGVAEIWSVDIPLRDGGWWYDDLARQIGGLLAELPPAEIAGSIGAESVDVSRFTREPPFSDTAPTALGRPTVSFIWRDDRCWTVGGRSMAPEAAAVAQATLVTALGAMLRQAEPDLDFAVVGIGKLGGFPDWIADLRVAPEAAIDEKAWLRRYATSHVVLGVHGSNMLLPASHAATVIELMPKEKWRHVGDTYDFVRRRDGLQALREFRFLPMSISISELALIARVMVRQARMRAFWAQSARLADDEERQRFRARHGHVFAYPEI